MLRKMVAGTLRTGLFWNRSKGYPGLGVREASCILIPRQT